MKHWLTKKITRPKIEAFIKQYATDKKTLDVGSSWSPYAKYFPNRISTDIEARDGVDIVADAHALPIDSNTYDVILCSEVLEHLHSPEVAIGEMYRVLKPGGNLILTTRFMFPMHDVPHDFFRYTEYGMLHLFREWEILNLQPESSNFETMAILVHRMAFTMEFKGGKFTRAVIFLFAKCIIGLGFLVKKEYGIRRMDGHHITCNTFSSGYYLYARKPL
jgi:predicted SAM-dependent methyltransferase